MVPRYAWSAIARTGWRIDQGTPVPLRRAFGSHLVATAFERGWARLENGTLIEAAESAGFERYVTTDKNLKYQQNLAGAPHRDRRSLDDQLATDPPSRCCGRCDRAYPAGR